MQEDADGHSGGYDSMNIKRESEISLVDLWIVLIKRKYIIAITFSIVLLTGFFYIMVTKPVYESKAVIQVGQVGQIVPPEVAQFAQASRQVIFIEVPSVLIKRLSAQIRPDSVLNASLKDECKEIPGRDT
jgi:LPS O-antigen subunit length determinant protein (WzzB/FepE family)